MSSSNSQCEQSLMVLRCFGSLLLLIPINEADYGGFAFDLLSHCSFLSPSLCMCSRFLSLCSSVVLMGCSGLNNDRLRVSPPHAPAFSHPPAIMPTCVRAPGRLNRFVKGPQWMREVRAPKPGPRVQVYPLWRHSAWGWNPCPLPPAAVTPPLLRHAEIIGLM